MTELVGSCLDKVSTVEKVQHQQFLRCARFYLKQLHHECLRMGYEDIEPKVIEMQRYLRCTPDQNIVEIRKRLYVDIEYLDQLIVAHRQDWESPFDKELFHLHGKYTN